MCAAFLCLALSVLPVAAALQTLRTPHNATGAWQAAASWLLALTLLVVLVAAGTGPWFVWGVTAMAASAAATGICLCTTAGPARSRASAAIAVAALLAAVCGSCSASSPHYPGVWTAPQDAATLNLSEATDPEQGGAYTLRVGTCTEEGKWALRHPQTTTSVQLWLDRESTLGCLPGGPATRAHIIGGNAAAPIISLPGLRLAKQ